jgi:glycosyltransferase involved in cell wall biosynthesis
MSIVSSESARKKRFLVSRTVTFYESDKWRDDVDLVDERAYVGSRVRKFPRPAQRWADRWFKFQFALRLLVQSRGYHGVAVGRYGMWLPVLQRLLRIHKPVVLTDVEWPKVKEGRLNRAAALGSRAILVFTSEEIARYSRQYNIPLEKFVLGLAPFERRYVYPASEQGYIFSGGAQARDWETLARAVEGLPYPVRVFSRDPMPFITPNMTVGAVSEEEYFSQMARASCVVVTVKSEPMRLTGMRTWTAAMAMGKVVIVTEALGAPDYMQQGVSGFYTDYADWKAVRRHIVQVMEDAELRRKVGQAARERAWREFSPDAFRSRVLALLEAQPTELAGSCS